MTFSLTWLPAALRSVGLTVIEQPDWQKIGHGDAGKTLGILCHHTATSDLKSTMPSLGILTHGRPDLQGPLANLGLGRDGTFFMIAAGKAWHAGKGLWQGVTDGNGHFIGIEAENSGLKNDSPWPVIQMQAYAKGCAAILRHIGAKPIMCAGHKEYALPKGRKPDPSFDMNAFRTSVAAIMDHL